MINKEVIQRRFGKALGFKSKGNTKIFAIKYTGDNAYDIQEFIEQGIFIVPNCKVIKCGQDMIKKDWWVIRYPLTFKNVTLKRRYSMCSDRVFKRNYVPWTEKFYTSEVEKYRFKRNNREIGTGKKIKAKSQYIKSDKKMQGE